MQRDPRITVLLHAMGSGDADAAEQLLPIVYEELRAVARSQMRRTPPGQTIQATALVHEAYLRLVAPEAGSFENRRHFFFAAARAMRQVLVDQARRRSALKRGGGRSRSAPEMLADIAITNVGPEDMLALDEALSTLEALHERAHKVVMLRFFAGLEVEQIAEILDITDRTARRDWRFAKAKLFAMLASNSNSPSPDDHPGET
ncbi:MAG: sigma-70 family RNA polymerase sigma factor [Phycisphaeraceae bacterium]|nr:sigma-70 family RNA polymerase sigma factor [Phycisphaerales bacterium]MCB9843615.1 sigma-70 family RNA polymerase sigma factor [Phycisphaeraceae bacterium]